MAVSNQLTQQQPKITEWLNKPEVQEDLMKKFSQDKNAVKLFVTNIIAVIANNPKLAKCSYPSIVSAALTANQLCLSLSPSLGHASIVPYGDKATFVPQVRGYVQLALRSGAYRSISVREVRKGEFVGLNAKDGEPVFTFAKDQDARAELPIIGYMAHFELLNGFEKTVYMSKSEALRYGDRYSPSFSLEAKNGRVSYADFVAGKYAKSDEWKYGKWYTDTDEMCKKSVLKQLLMRYGILSIEMQTAFASDYEEEEKNEEKETAVETDFFDEEEKTEQPEEKKEEPTVKRRGRKKAGEIANEENAELPDDFFDAEEGAPV